MDTISETNKAAQRCVNKTTNGYTDWFLPSLGELNEMYKAKGKTNIPITGYYWSSSEHNNNLAWGQGFDLGSQYDYAKYDDTFSVRAVRAF